MLVGATGLVDCEVLSLALADPKVQQVVAPTRRALPAHAKLLNPVVDFAALPEDADWWAVDAVVCALGTTVKTAGSQAAFPKWITTSRCTWPSWRASTVSGPMRSTPRSVPTCFAKADARTAIPHSRAHDIVPSLKQIWGTRAPIRHDQIQDLCYQLGWAYCGRGYTVDLNVGARHLHHTYQRRPCATRARMTPLQADVAPSPHISRTVPGRG